MKFEENEISAKANGGSEIVKRLIGSRMPEEYAEDFQVILSRVRKIEEDKIRIYWLQDLPEDPETNHLKNAESRNRFHKIVFCGQWQYNRYLSILGLPQDDKCIVIDNTIRPIEFIPKPTDKINLIYTSTPQRGLAILVPVFIELAKKYPNIHLNVFSSFAIYGWNERDTVFQQLFDTCKNHPQITYHGSQPNDVVREYLQRSHIMAFPSIWQECSSHALIEAMSAGLLCVHSNLAGNCDTSGSVTRIYQYNEDINKHAHLFYNMLEKAIGDVFKPETANEVAFVKKYADTRFDLEKITSKWVDLMGSLREQYPTRESRMPAKQMFVYRTN